MENSYKKLIFELNKEEREYFLKFANLGKRSSNASYLIIYEQLIRNGAIDLNELKRIFGEKNFSKNISIAKEKLLEKILLSLVNYNVDSSYSWNIQRDILLIKVLIERRLPEKTQKLINRAKKNAYLYEEFELLNQIIAVEIELCFDMGFIKNSNKLKQLIEEKNKINFIINELHYLLTLKADLQSFQTNENIYTSSLNNFKSIFGYLPKITENIYNCKKIKNIQFYIEEACYFIQYNYEKFFLTTKEHYEFHQQNSILFPKYEYLQLLANYLYGCSLMENEEQFNIILNEFTNIKNLNKEEEQYANDMKFYRTLELYHRLSKHKDAEKLAHQAEEFLDNNYFLFDSYKFQVLHLNIIRAYIENKNYSAAIVAFQKKYKQSGIEFNSSLFKLFEFITHYKLNNFENLIYSVDSWTKTIRSKRNQFPIEKILIKFFRSVSNKVTINEKKQLISNIITQLKVVEKDNQKFYLNHIFDFIEWFERELEEMK